MPLTTRRLAVGAPARRADVIVQELTGLSRSQIRGLFDAGCVEVDGQPSAAGDVVAPAAELVVTWDPTRRYKEKPKLRPSRAFALVFEDAHLLVVDKAAGVLTVPTDKREDFTLVSELARHVSRGRRITHRVSIVHRLDRDTSGLLVFAKAPDLALRLKDQFAARKPEREYYAVVAGQVTTDRGTFRSYLRTNAILDQESTDDADDGKLAVTHYEVVERLRGATAVRVRLETGRRNQIRVHFAEAGHPVLGDVRYQVQRARHPLWRHKRLALHAAVLGLVHPVTGAPLRFTSKLPEELERFLAAARGGGAGGRGSRARRRR